MIQDIKETLQKNGALTIRGFTRVFGKLDLNKNHQIDVNELRLGLEEFKIYLNDA